MHAGFLEISGDAQAARLSFFERMSGGNVEEVGKVSSKEVYVLADWGLGGG